MSDTDILDYRDLYGMNFSEAKPQVKQGPLPLPNMVVPIRSFKHPCPVCNVKAWCHEFIDGMTVEGHYTTRRGITVKCVPKGYYNPPDRPAKLKRDGAMHYVCTKCRTSLIGGSSGMGYCPKCKGVVECGK